MTFRKYSRLTSSSFLLELGAGDAIREGDSVGMEEKEFRDSTGLFSGFPRVVQYPTPGFRCRSSSAADD